jgi:hypothetical protein
MASLYTIPETAVGRAIEEQELIWRKRRKEKDYG